MTIETTLIVILGRLLGVKILCVKVAAWLQNLRWPLDKQGPLGKEAGISWVELGLSLTFFCGHFLPVLREDANKDKRVIYPGSRASAEDLQISCYEIGNVCKQLFDHIESLAFGYALPSFAKKKVSSLYVQGAFLSALVGIIDRRFPSRDVWRSSDNFI